MIRFVRLLWTAAVIAAAVPAYGQSLGEIARQEEARRAGGSKSVKTLTNASLDPSAIAPAAGAAPVAASCYMSIKLGRCVSADEMIANSAAGSLTRELAPLEPKWRQDAAQLRSQIERTQRSIATLETVVADGTRAASERKSAEQTLTAARQALAGFERQWVKLETTAGTQKIPRAWIEPIPALSSRAPQQQ
ncbi:MAG TPA: hypothetical protein VFZ31_14525 [Vicinamibacterales bacterium]